MFLRLFAVLALTHALTGAAYGQDAQTNLQRISLLAGMYKIDAQVAQTPTQRQIGLMFRKEMPQTEGMCSRSNNRRPSASG